MGSLQAHGHYGDNSWQQVELAGPPCYVATARTVSTMSTLGMEISHKGEISHKVEIQGQLQGST